jgi:hypothetical protein
VTGTLLLSGFIVINFEDEVVPVLN